MPAPRLALLYKDCEEFPCFLGLGDFFAQDRERKHDGA